jgi:hypothetical protein
MSSSLAEVLKKLANTNKHPNAHNAILSRARRLLLRLVGFGRVGSFICLSGQSQSGVILGKARACVYWPHIQSFYRAPRTTAYRRAFLAVECLKVAGWRRMRRHGRHTDSRNLNRHTPYQAVRPYRRSHQCGAWLATARTRLLRRLDRQA